MDFSRNQKSMFPALGAGKTLGDENQLIQAPELEEDFDVLNDETFGDLGTADYDWEDEHNRMAVELEGSSFFDTEQEENNTRDSGFATMDKGHSTITTQEDELEQSINRLMVDDSDSKAFNANGQPIPGIQRKSHLDALFGAPGYMDLENLGSPRKNIWGSPSGDSHIEKPVNHTLQALFASVKQAGAGDFPGIFSDAKGQGGPAVPLPMEAPTLAEIEHNMMARERQKPRVFTAEEVERQLRGEPPLPSETRRPYSVPEQIPPVGTSVSFRRPSNQGPLGMVGHQLANGQSSPINILSQHGHPVPGMHASQDSAVISMGRSPSPSHLPQGIPPAMLAHSPRLMTPYNPAAVFMANQLLGNAMARPPPVHPPPTHVPPPNVNVASPFGSPYGSPSAAVLASRVSQVPVPPMVDQHSPPNRPRMAMPSGLPPNANHMQYNSLPPQHPFPHPHHPRPGMPMGPGQPYQHDYREPYNANRNNQQYHQRSYNESSSMNANEEEDEYAGLMSRKEKDWIIKIQLLQLQTENPYLDDYYYTYYMMKKKAASNTQTNGTAVLGLSGFELLIPSTIKLEARNYTPAQFEGSLGRLTAASVHNPRQIIDVCRNVSPTNEESAQKNVSKELRRLRQLLMDIEKGFNVILDVDDIEKKVLALPVENRLPLFQERLEKIQTVYDYFMQDDSLKNFVPTLGVRKGRKLLARLMPLLDKVQWLSIVTVLLSHLPTLIKKDQEEEGLFVLMRPLSHFLAQCNLECLVHFAAILQKHPEQNAEGLTLLLHNSFGITLLCCLLQVGEEIFKNTTIDLDNQHKTQWSGFMEEFIENLESVPKDRLAWPPVPHPLVNDHVDRFINNKQMSSIEEKLAHFSKPRPKGEEEEVDSSSSGNAGQGLVESGNKKRAMVAS